MKCFICNSSADYYFTKDFNCAAVTIDRMFNLGKVEYFQCPNCGFVFSKTHAEIDRTAWENLNKNYHSLGESPDYEKEHNPPPYLQQAAFLKISLLNTIIAENILDWGGGYGTLSGILEKYFNVHVKVYDKYMQSYDRSDVDYIQSDELLNQKFNTVINSAVFEHVTKREHLEEINNCVSEDGCLFIHTVICEKIPKDPEWFYLGAVHCAFHTNKSMNILMSQWGYKSSIYSPLAKGWILLRSENDAIEESVRKINQELQFNYLYYKKGFMDYWK
jgi:hypothetical protein